MRRRKRKQERRQRPSCTFCSESASTELDGARGDEAGLEHEVVYACWRSQHSVKGRAYLAGRGFGNIRERTL